jgi:glycosyltransferase involved in cell wall biosynthesis
MHFSVIICTYNPDKRILLRTLRSVAELTLAPSFSAEVLIVDNNSSNNFLNENSIQKEIAGISNCSVHTEKKQGLVYARLKGFDEAKGDWLVFVDDDNELEKNYLTGLNEAIQKNKTVLCWGPGKITVDFIDGAQVFVSKYFKALFQEKDLAASATGNEKGWHSYYPTGSGLSIDRTILEIYKKHFTEGKINAVGRQGENLSSGEEKRCTLKYMTALNFNLAYDYYKGYYEYFKDEKVFDARPTAFSFLKLWFRSLKRSFPLLNSAVKIYKIESAWLKGYIKFSREFKK